MHRTTLLALLLAGCAKGTEKPDTDTGVAPDIDIYTTGSAPWDPYFTRIDYDRAPTERVAPLLDGAEASVALSDHEGVYAWRADGDLAEGTHTLTYGDQTATLIVEPYGIDSAFSAEAIVGQVYELDMETLWFSRSGPIGSVLDVVVDSLYLSVDSVDGDQAAFSIFAQEGGSTCAALRATGTLSETGQLSWSEDELVINTKQGEVSMWDLSLRVGWLADGSVAGGAETAATVHTALLSQEILIGDTGGPGDPGEICAYFSNGLSLECYDCDGDGEYCTDIIAHSAVLYPVDDEDGRFADAETCGVDLDDAGDYNLGCSMPTISCSASTFGLIGLTGWLGRRRRRRERAEA